MRIAIAALLSLVVMNQAAATDPLDTEVYIFDGGSIYHTKECVSLTGRVNVRAVKLRELGHGWDRDSYCRPKTRPVGAPFGPIAAEYRNILTPPVTPLTYTLPPATAATADAAAPSIRQKCAADWLTDVEMRALCENKQKVAAASLNARSMTTLNQNTIRGKCQADWPSDYEMRNYCEQQQLKALAKTGGGD
jgi:hypothetical protein